MKLIVWFGGIKIVVGLFENRHQHEWALTISKDTHHLSEEVFAHFSIARWLPCAWKFSSYSIENKINLRYARINVKIVAVAWHLIYFYFKVQLIIIQYI